MTPELHQHHVPQRPVLVAEPMPDVQSAAFTLLIPAGAAYRAGRPRRRRRDARRVDHPGGRRPRQPRAALGPRRAGRRPLRGGPDGPRQRLGRDARQEPDPGPRASSPTSSAAPGSRTRRSSRSGPSALQSLQSLEDDPGSKVIYELRRRHFPDPWGRPSSGRRGGRRAITPDDLRGHYRRHFRPNGAILGRRRAPSTGRRSATPSAGSSATGRPARPRGRRAADRPGSRAHRAGDPADADRPGLPDASRSPTPTTTGPGPRRRSSAATRRPGSSPRSARSGASATRSSPATRPRRTGPPCSATPAPPATAPSRPST